MAISKTMFITSSVVTGGCLVAWAIVAGVSAGGRNSRNSKRNEKYEMLKMLGGSQTAAQAEIADAVEDGTISDSVGSALKEVVSSSNGGRFASVVTGGDRTKTSQQSGPVRINLSSARMQPTQQVSLNALSPVLKKDLKA